MLLLRPPALSPAPSRPRHRARARPFTNTPTYPRKPRRAASAGEGCATAVTPEAFGMVAPPQCQPSAGQQQPLCGAREVEEAPCCVCVRGEWCVCAHPRPTLEPVTLARAALSVGIVLIGQAGPTSPPRRPPGRCAHVLTCHVSRHSRVGVGGGLWVAGFVCASQRVAPHSGCPEGECEYTQHGVGAGAGWGAHLSSVRVVSSTPFAIILLTLPRTHSSSNQVLIP